MANTMAATAVRALLLVLSAEGGPVPDWAWNARMAAVAITLSETPDELAALADRLARAGYTVATVHPGPLCYDILDYGNPRHIPALRTLADAFHARGIRVVLKTMSLWQNKRQFPQYERTAGTSAKSGRTSYHLPPRPGARAWYSCLNHPLIRDAHVRQMPKLLAATGLDGFMTDALVRPDMYACVCEHCRRKFKADTGRDVPTSIDAPFWDNAADPAYRAWRLWRFKSVTDFLADIRHALAALDPPRLLVAYTAPGIPSMLTSATDHEVLADAGAGMIGQEIGVGPASPYNWRYILAKLRHLHSLCQRRGRVPFAIFHNTYAKSCPAFFRALAWSCGVRKWEYPEPYGAVRGVLVSKAARRWDREHEELLTRVRVPATVAIVYSRRSYVLVKSVRRSGRGRKDSGDREYFGWAEFLIENNIPYHSLVDRDLNEQTLADYRVLVLPNVACLGAAEADAVRRFVAAGGRLIAVGETSLYSATGRRRADLQLGEVLGVAYREGLRSGATLRLGPTLSGLLHHGAATHEADDRASAGVARHGRSEQLAEIASSGKAWPGIVASRFGRGRTVYFAGNPGQRVFHMVNFLGSRGGTWVAPRASLYKAIMAWALGDEVDPPLRAITVPKGVVVSLLRQSALGPERTLVHVANLRLTETEPDGAPIAKGREVVYPPVPGPIVVEVKAPWPSRAYAVSPDFPGRRMVAATRAKDYVRIEIPNLVRYCVVCVERSTRKPASTMSRSQSGASGNSP